VYRLLEYQSVKDFLKEHQDKLIRVVYRMMDITVVLFGVFESFSDDGECFIMQHGPKTEKIRLDRVTRIGEFNLLTIAALLNEQQQLLELGRHAINNAQLKLRGFED